MSPLVKMLARFGVLTPPKFVYLSCFSKCIELAFNVLYGIAMLNILTAIWLLSSL